MEDWGIWAGQAAILAPFCVAVCAALFSAGNPPDRYKPIVSLAVGIILGIALSYSQGQRFIDGAWIGAIGGLTASGLYYFGKVAEKSGAVALESKTTIYEPTKPVELPPKPVELPHG